MNNADFKYLLEKIDKGFIQVDSDFERQNKQINEVKDEVKEVKMSLITLDTNVKYHLSSKNPCPKITQHTKNTLKVWASIITLCIGLITLLVKLNIFK